MVNHTTICAEAVLVAGSLTEVLSTVVGAPSYLALCVEHAVEAAEHPSDFDLIAVPTRPGPCDLCEGEGEDA